MKKLPAKGLKYLKYLHLIGTGMWFGGALGMLVVLYFAHPSTPDGYYIRSQTIMLLAVFWISITKPWKKKKG